MSMNSRFGLLAALSFAALGAYVGCGGDSGGGDTSGGNEETTGPVAQTGDLEIAFNPMYSGFDGAHTYQIPVKALGVKNVTFTASNNDLVRIEKTADGAMITTKGAGEVTITGTAGGLKGTAKLTITKYTPEEWEAGNKRYNEGEALKVPEFDPCNPPRMLPTVPKRLSCTNCHGTTATLGDVEHTPQQTGGYSDEQLISIFNNATKPEGVEMRSMIPKQIWQYFHKWETSDAERKGLLAYLRAIAPKAQGAFDFGAVPGGGMRPVCDGGVGGTTTTADAGVDGG